MTSVLIGRLCGRDELGMYALAMGLVQFVQGIQDQVICTPNMIYGSRKQGRELQVYSGSVLIHQLVLILLGLIGLSVAAVWLPRGSGWSSIVLVLLAFSPFLLLREFVRQFSMSRLRPGIALSIDCGVCVLQLAGLAWFGWNGQLTIPLAFGIAGVSCLLAAAAWFVMRRNDFSIDLRATLSDWQNNWAFSRWPLLGQFTGSATPYFIPWIVVASHGASAAGLFAACSTLVGLSRMFVAGVNNVVIPRASRAYALEGASGLRHILRNTTLLYSITLGGFCLLVLIAGEFAAVATFGDKYSGSGAIMTFLALNVLATSLGQTAGNGLFAVLQPRANFVADIVSLLVTLAAAAALVPTWGATGAAAATFVGTASGAVWRSFTLRQVLRDVTRSPVTA